MIKLLKRIVEFLETRFPPKVVVTEQDYRQMQERIETILKLAVADYEKIEAKVNSVDKAAVTAQMQLNGRMAEIEKWLNDMNSHYRSIPSKEFFDKRISAVEDSINALKEGIVKGEIRPAVSERERDRAAFINGDLSRLPQISRREIEAAANK